jgi:hypothetical protein
MYLKHTHRRLAALASRVGAVAALATLGLAGPAAASVNCGAPGFGAGDSTPRLGRLRRRGLS